ncbi:uncharacterized protein CLUP02_04472 [Colletotrichum lupini]|uniref:Uncharacterized protein n=1 Tax=Colletotrichum lupini TaxID=145971 RepID=A0A9Q8SKV3_9PEZI|nr:uncharacterized protein CLUP02_04472 [Colletotrichum lupini]UQC78993.1 hypothetical protein CLUP02_04472 [Colletotrichum lupini]
MRLTGALTLLLAVATASPVAVADVGSKDVKKINGLPVVSVEALQSIEARDALIAKDVIAAGKADAPVENSLQARVWPASHQSDHFRAGNSWANRVKTRIIVSGVHLVVTAWFNDIHTMFVQFEPDFPSGAFTHCRDGFNHPWPYRTLYNLGYIITQAYFARTLYIKTSFILIFYF